MQHLCLKFKLAAAVLAVAWVSGAEASTHVARSELTDFLWYDSFYEAEPFKCDTIAQAADGNHNYFLNNRERELVPAGEYEHPF